MSPRKALLGERQALYRAPEARVLSDADLIDANLGLVAFYRNIQIHAGRMLQQTGSVNAVAYLDLAERWISSRTVSGEPAHSFRARGGRAAPGAEPPGDGMDHRRERVGAGGMGV